MDQRVSVAEYRKYFADLLCERFQYFDATFGNISSQLDDLDDISVFTTSDGVIQFENLLGRLEGMWKVSYSTIGMTQQTTVDQSLCGLFLTNNVTDNIMANIHKIANKQAQKDRVFVLYDGYNYVNSTNILWGVRLYHSSRINDLFEELQATLATPIKEKVLCAKLEWAANVVEKVLGGVDWSDEEKLHLHTIIWQRCILKGIWRKICCVITWLAIMLLLFSRKSPFASPFRQKEHILSAVPTSRYDADMVLLNSTSDRSPKGHSSHKSSKEEFADYFRALPRDISLSKSCSLPYSLPSIPNCWAKPPALYRPEEKIARKPQDSVQHQDPSDDSKSEICVNRAPSTINATRAPSQNSQTQFSDQHREGAVEIASFGQKPLPAPSVTLLLMSSHALVHDSTSMVPAFRPVFSGLASELRPALTVIRRVLKKVIRAMKSACRHVLRLLQFAVDALMLRE